MGRERVLRRLGLVKVYTEAGPFVGPEVAVADLRSAGENLARGLREDVLFLNPEVVARQVERQIRRVADRRDVAWPVPGRSDPEELAEGGELPADAQPADVRQVDSDEVDQPIPDQRNVLRLVDEQLTIAMGVDVCWRMTRK